MNSVIPDDKHTIDMMRKIILVEVIMWSINKPEPEKIRIRGTLIPSFMFNVKFSEIKK